MAPFMRIATWWSWATINSINSLRCLTKYKGKVLSNRLGHGSGAARKAVAIALTIKTLSHPQLVEILRLWQKERLEVTLGCSLDSSSFLPFERIGHLRRTDTSDDEGMAD
jgi:hypothetical protein